MSVLRPKIVLITGAAKRVGFQVGVCLAETLPPGSKIYLTTVNAPNIANLNADIKARNIKGGDMISYVGLDFTQKKSINELWKTIKTRHDHLDILINNSQKYLLTSILNDKIFHTQAKETINVNYYGLKKMCQVFTPMLNQSSRIVNCTSHLGHLSNIDGKEPQATLLRKRFADHRMDEQDLDNLVKEFLELTAQGGGAHYQAGWPSCPYTVSKLAVNSYTKILQCKYDTYHLQRDLAVNAVHHGAMHRLMNTTRGFTDVQAAHLVKNVALLPEYTTVRGKVIWKDMMTFDNWQYGGLDDKDKTEKAFVSSYDIEEDFIKHQPDMNYGFCLDG
jgi:carbonyl reductase 1